MSSSAIKRLGLATSLRWLHRISSGSWRRSFWTGMFVVHACALGSGWARAIEVSDAGTGPALLELLGLVLSLGFFGLKMADVPWLRLAPGWRPFVASWAVVALLHVNVLEQTTPDRVVMPGAEAALVQVVGTLVGFALLRRPIRRALSRLAQARQAAGEHLDVMFCGRAWSHSARLSHRLAPVDTWTPRGPPLL